ncbi:MAG: cytochrome c-type biogenesis CcmF C-terminal domain-containing protein, partial [Rhodospirillaceae bacterium]
SQIKGPNYSGIQGQFEVNMGGDVITILKPEKRRYEAERSETTEAAIFTTLKGDLYGVLGEASGKGAWSTRFYFNPLVSWIWAGAIFMAIGGLISLTDRRLRVGAPKLASKPISNAAK